MGYRHLVRAVPGDFLPLFVMDQIVIDLIQQIPLILIKNKIFPRRERSQKVGLKIAQQKASASHDVKGSGADKFTCGLEIFGKILIPWNIRLQDDAFTRACPFNQLMIVSI